MKREGKRNSTWTKEREEKQPLLDSLSWERERERERAEYKRKGFRLDLKRLSSRRLPSLQNQKQQTERQRQGRRWVNPFASSSTPFLAILRWGYSTFLWHIYILLKLISHENWKSSSWNPPFQKIVTQVVMLGLDAAGKTTILYKLHIGEVLSTVPTIGWSFLLLL